MDQLTAIFEEIRRDLTARNNARDLTLNRSRELTRLCAHAIRAAHRHEFAEAAQLLADARTAAALMTAELRDMPDLIYAGYTQDALKELVEAHLVYAFVTGSPLPTPRELGVPSSTYLNGVSEAATEMRRFALDLIRRGRVVDAEPLLAIMDDVYGLQIAIDFPDAITGGLRRQTDVLRGTLERTRGDLTLAIRQDEMRTALAAFETRVLGSAVSDQSISPELALFDQDGADL